MEEEFEVITPKETREAADWQAGKKSPDELLAPRLDLKLRKRPSSASAKKKIKRAAE